jgi:basic membrane protein A
MTLAALLAVGAMALAACGGGKSVTGGDEKSEKKSLKVGLAFDIGGLGDRSFNDAAYAGLKRIEKDLNLDTKYLSAKANEPPADKEERLRLLAKAGYNPIIAVGFAYTEALTKVAKEYADVKFAIVDGVIEGATNVNGLTFAEHEGSFLVGAAAALKTKTKNVGYIGGCDVPLLHKFQAGFEAGVKAVDPSIKIQAKYLSSPPGCTGFNDPAAGKTTATGMYDATADIIYAAAGGSGSGVFQAAKAKGAKAIGVDSDQYQTADPAVKDVIMTSMLKRVDNAVYDFVKKVSEDKFTSGVTVYDLKVDGVGYSTSGGQIDDITGKLDEYKKKIVDGEIKVPEK